VRWHSGAFQRFADFYNELYPGRGGVGRQPMCVGPIAYVGQSALQADIDNMKAALAASPAEEAFMSAIAPGTFGRGVNQHYKDDEAFLFAIAEALRTEYEAIVHAGFVLEEERRESMPQTPPWVRTTVRGFATSP